MGLIPKEFKELLDPSNIAKIKEALREFALEVDAIYKDTEEILNRLDKLEEKLENSSKTVQDEKEEK